MQDLGRAPGSSGVRHTFDYAYRNGRVHRIKAISFDYGIESQKLEKAGALAFEAHDGGEPIDAIIQKASAAVDDDAYTKAFQILGSVRNLECKAVSTDDDRSARYFGHRGCGIETRDETPMPGQTIVGYRAKDELVGTGGMDSLSGVGFDGRTKPELVRR